MKQFFKILLIGPQASGKGTQAQILSEKFNLPIFAAGNILRQKMAEGDELGKQIAELVNRGNMVPNELINRMMEERIKREGGNGYILDGYPRSLGQAKFLDGLDKLTHVFEISISDEEAVRRISGRRTCPKCQTVYHIKYNPPKKEGVCDKDGAKLVVRDDEKPEIVQQRLKTYHELTEPVLEHYQKQGIYYKINGEQPIEEVSQDILAVLENKAG